MASALEPLVTPAGIRDGDPATLAALVERRGGAVLAYCEQACPPPLAVPAAAEAFARFRAVVATIVEPAGVDPDRLLLEATRGAAAAVADAPPPADAVDRAERAFAAPPRAVPTGARAAILAVVAAADPDPPAAAPIGGRAGGVPHPRPPRHVPAGPDVGPLYRVALPAAVVAVALAVALAVAGVLSPPAPSGTDRAPASAGGAPLPTP